MDRPAAVLGIGAFFSSAGAACIGIASVEHSPGDSFARNGWFVVGLVLFLIGSITTLVSVVALVADWVGRCRNPLNIAFDMDDDRCVQRRVTIALPDLQLRIRATNRSKNCLSNVRAEFLLLPTGYTHAVRIMHDNEPPFTRSVNGVDCLPEHSVYFDIVFKQLDENRIFYQYADESLINTQRETPVYLDRQTIEIGFYCRWDDTKKSVTPIVRRYVLAPYGQFDCILHPLP